MKILVVVQNIREAQSFYSTYAASQSSAGHEWIVFSSDAEAESFLREKEISCLGQREIASYRDYAGVSDKAYELAATWWQGRVASSLRECGQDPGVCAWVEWEATYLFLWVLNSIVLMQKLLTYHPHEVWANPTRDEPCHYFYGGMDPSLYGTIILDLARKARIPTRFVVQRISTRRGRLSAEGLRGLVYRAAGYRHYRTLIKTPRLSLSQHVRLATRDGFSMLAAWASYGCHVWKRGFRKDTRGSFLVSSSYDHVATVIRELLQRGHRVSFFRWAFSVRQAWRFGKNGIAFFSPIQFWRPKFGKDPFRTAWRSVRGDILGALREIEPFRGYAFGPLLMGKWNYLFESYLPSLIRAGESLRRLLRWERIERLIMEEDVCVFNKVLAQVARTEGIPSVVVQHGATGLRIGFCPLTATRFVAWGDFSRQRMVEWGTPDDRLVVTGNCRNDSTVSSRTDVEPLWQTFGLDPRKKTVLLAMFPFRDYSITDFPETRHSMEMYDDVLRKVLEAVRASGAKLLVKLHPRDDRERTALLVRKWGDHDIAFIDRGTIISCLDSTDCVISVMSSVLVDVLPYRKPMILLDLTGDVEQADRLLALDIPVAGMEGNQLQSILALVLKGEIGSVQEETVRRHLHKLDGKATGRIVDLIVGLKPLRFHRRASAVAEQGV